MKPLLSTTLAALLLQSFLSLALAPASAEAQTATPPPASQDGPATQVVKPAVAFGLQDATPVKLRTTRNLSSADAKEGETVDFEVLEDVKSGDTVLIPRGGVALGTVTRAKPKGRMGKGGKLDITIDSVRLATGEKVALRAVKETKGGSHTGAMTGAMVATGILFFPAAPLFLFMKGKDIKIPKGTDITAYINGDVPLDPAKFTAAAATPDGQPAVNPQATASASCTMTIKSDPEGAEITIDGKYVGNTPSTIQLEPGDHTISLKKANFAAWEKTITATAGGNVTVGPTLEKIP
jgi:hypothetical protein